MITKTTADVAAMSFDETLLEAVTRFLTAGVAFEIVEGVAYEYVDDAGHHIDWVGTMVMRELGTRADNDFKDIIHY
jgi:hypothetical protein